jgi:PBP1b-binding outer membrane lipoprotein LpoB
MLGILRKRLSAILLVPFLVAGCSSAADDKQR